MGLKLTVSKGDKIHIGDDVVIDILMPAATKMQVEVNAPKDVNVYTEFADKSKQHKNRRRAEELQDAIIQRDHRRRIS